MMEAPGLKFAGPLGKGGTAQVAKAFSSDFKRDVAVKFPLLQDQDSIAQFCGLARREHQLIGHLKFPGFVNLLRHSDNPAYLLLELCRGQSLDKLGKVDDPQMLLVIVSAVAADLEFVRINKIVHCDLKPHNVFLPSDFPLYDDGDLFFAKISDFSLGRSLDEPESARAGHGTVGYAAPETMRAGKTSHRADLFSLGVIAYQLASGRHPFIDNEIDPIKIECRIQEDEPVPLTLFRNDLPPDFIKLVKALLAKDEKVRPETAWEVCEILGKCGCNYPFEKVISPSFVLKTHSDYDKFTEQFLELSDKQKKQLTAFTDSKLDFLRIVLSANFVRKNLIYNGQRFVIKSNVYWPSYLRRQSLVFFAGSAWAGKKEIVRAAISGNISTDTASPPGTAILFSHLLSGSYVKNHSVKFAVKNESTGDFMAATKLYLQAGEFERARGCAERATANLVDAIQRVEGVHLINRVLELAQMSGREFDTRTLLMVKGNIERTGGNTDGALETYNRIIELYRDRPTDKLLAETYRGLGDIFKTKQKFNDGIKVLNKAQEIYRGLRDELEESRTLNAIGGIYRIATDLPNALKFMRQALAIQKRLVAVSDAASSLNNMAIIYGTTGRLKRAIALLTISLKMKRTLDDQGEIARTLNNLGYANFLIDKSAVAEPLLEESLAINRNLGSKKEILYNLWNLSEVSFKIGALYDCLKYLEEGLQLAKTLADKPHMGRYHLSFGNILRRLCRFSEANRHFDEVCALANEIDDEILKMNLEISRAELRFQVGDSKMARTLAETALQKAQNLKTQPEILAALNTLIKVTGQDKYLKNARDLTADKHLSKDRLIVELNYIHFLIESDFIHDAQKLVGSYGAQLFKLPNDIEMPRLLNVLAEYHIKRKEYSEASAILGNSYESANAMGLLIDEMKGAILQGNVAFGVGSYEQSYSKYKYALQLCKQIVNNIGDESDKKLFMNKPSVKFLMAEIKRLSEKMVVNKKAGV